MTTSATASVQPIVPRRNSVHDDDLDLYNDLGTDVFKVVVDEMTQNVFVGGDNVVIKLDKDLNHLGDTILTSCSGSSCPKNVVQVMEVSHTPRKLLVCGSHDNGQCWFVDLDDLSVIGVNKSGDANGMDGFGHRVFVGPPP